MHSREAARCTATTRTAACRSSRAGFSGSVTTRPVALLAGPAPRLPPRPRRPRLCAQGCRLRSPTEVSTGDWSGSRMFAFARGVAWPARHVLWEPQDGLRRRVGGLSTRRRAAKAPIIVRFGRRTASSLVRGPSADGLGRRYRHRGQWTTGAGITSRVWCGADAVHPGAEIAGLRMEAASVGEVAQAAVVLLRRGRRRETREPVPARLTVSPRRGSRPSGDTCLRSGSRASTRSRRSRRHPPTRAGSEALADHAENVLDLTTKK
jgi:hypothetical protein